MYLVNWIGLLLLLKIISKRELPILTFKEQYSIIQLEFCVTISKF